MAALVFQSIHQRDRLQAFLRQDPYLHLYCLGDLEEFYFRHTVWYGKVESGGNLEALVMGYFSSHPVFLAYASSGQEQTMKELLNELKPFFPRNFYLHVTNGLGDCLLPDYQIEHAQMLCRMALRQPALLDEVTEEGERLQPRDLEEVSTFYGEAYPGNWFEARMLECGQYFGIRREGRLAAVAGVHVYSPSQRVAALGNIATHPRWRGQGLSTAVTAKLCRSLLETTDVVGLNVLTDNEAAIRCYRKLGFESHAVYEELKVVANLVG